MSPLQMLADVLVRIFRVLSAIARRTGAGLRWLARQTYRQRSLGVAASPQLTRLLDLHAVTLAGQVAVIAAIILAPGGPIVMAWVISGFFIVVTAVLGLWRPGRLLLGLLVALQGIIAVIGAQWLRDSWIVLLTLLALALAQQATLAALWSRHSVGWSALARATAAGLLLGVFTGGVSLVIGLIWPSLPLWLAALVFTGAAILTITLPAPAPTPAALPAHPRSHPTAALPTRPGPAASQTRPGQTAALPAQTRPGQPSATPAVPSQPTSTPPDGYAVYRPSSLDPKD